MSGFSDKSLDGWIMKEDGTTLGLKPSSTDTSIPQHKYTITDGLHYKCNRKRTAIKVSGVMRVKTL